MGETGDDDVIDEFIVYELSREDEDEENNEKQILDMLQEIPDNETVMDPVEDYEEIQIEYLEEHEEIEELNIEPNPNGLEESSQSTETGTKKLNSSGPKRYVLYDDLVANIVDYDADNIPIVQFSMIDALKDKDLPMECGICPDVMDRSKLAKHLTTHLNTTTNRYSCLYCDETYKDYKYLAGHARRHMGIRPYVCDICKLYFSTKQDLRVHNQRRHQAKSHICEICGKTFSQNTMLKRHRESTHEKKRRFQCEYCPKAYYKNFSLLEHVKSVHMGQRRMLVCPFCGMQCMDAHKMARHRKLWHLNQSEFECEVCQEKFTEVSYFDAHKRSIQCRNNTRRKLEEERLQLQQQEQEAQKNSDQEEILQNEPEEADLTENELKNDLEDDVMQDPELINAIIIQEGGLYHQGDDGLLYEIAGE